MTLLTPWRARLLAGSLLVVAGALAIGAAVRRWAADCAWGDFDSPGCVRLQDHAYDVALTPTLGLLAVAVLLLPWLAPRPRRSAIACGAGLALSLLVPGGTLVWILGWPVLAAFALPGVRRRGLLVLLLSITNPIAQYLLAAGLVGYGSYDTTPWSEAVLGATLLAIAAAVLVPPLSSPSRVVPGLRARYRSRPARPVPPPPAPRAAPH